MANYMMDNGLMGKKMEVECGKVINNLILGNGKMVEFKVLVFIQ